MTGSNEYIEEMQAQESAYFDAIANRRTLESHIPLEADIRRATKYIPDTPGMEIIDPRITEIIQGRERARFIREVAWKHGGDVVDVCCGPGWLALELARRGCHVNAYDLSPHAIAVARRMATENPYREDFGGVTYHVADVTREPLPANSIDAISGWSAFHHLPNLLEFMGRVHTALRPGGVIATMDDYPPRRRERYLGYFFRFILPTYDRSYRNKIAYGVRRLFGRIKDTAYEFSPMEAAVAKDSLVFEFADYLHEHYEIVWDQDYLAFALRPAMSVVGPDWFRYGVARCLIALDRALCASGVCRGFVRIIIARKRA